MPTRKRDPSAKRRFIAKFTTAPTQTAEDTSIPAFGQRKRKTKRRPLLIPPQTKAD